MKEILHVEVVVEEEFAGIFHARLGGQVGVSSVTKLWNEIDRHMTMVEGHNGTHRTTITASRPLQNIHAGDWIGNILLTTWHIRLEYDVESVDVYEIERQPGLQRPDRVED